MAEQTIAATLARRVDTELAAPTVGQRLTERATFYAATDLPAPVTQTALGVAALEERRAAKARTLPLIVEAWHAAGEPARRQVIDNEGPVGLYTWRKVAQYALAGKPTNSIPAPRRAIQHRSDPRWPKLVSQVHRLLGRLDDTQLAAVLNWSSPAGMRRILAELTCGVPVERRARRFDQPDAADAWFAELRADGWTLVEPDVWDRRQAQAGDVLATVGVFQPSRQT
ncbi:hypothetical protein ACGFIY_21535 [Micromonospora chersina]|uniref:hypothetical protein n=1 Tax=Micromonospora chersina TaxID=47854 RepID=UPI0037172896